jgi:hypothetical protein
MRWVYIRLALLATNIPYGMWLAHIKGDFPDSSSLMFFLEMTGLCAGSVFVVCAFQSLKTSIRYARPSWDQSPFTFSEPPGVFAFGGEMLLAAGLGAFVVWLFMSPPNWIWELLVSMGTGILIGAHLSANSSTA